MTDIASWLEGSVQDWAFGGTDMPTAPTDIYVALHTDAPGNDATANEVGAADYQRAQTAPADWAVLAGDGPTTAENSNDIVFVEATSDWGIVSHVSLWTSAQGGGGNPLYQGAMDDSDTIATGDQYVFRSGELGINLD